MNGRHTPITLVVLSGLLGSIEAVFDATQCRLSAAQVDVLFIMDTSKSVYQSGNLEESLRFMYKAVEHEQVNISADGVHVSLINYADWAKVTLKFNDFYNKSGLSGELTFPSKPAGCFLATCPYVNGNLDWVADKTCKPGNPTSPTYDSEAPSWLADTQGKCYRGSGLLMSSGGTSYTGAIQKASEVMNSTEAKFGTRENVTKIIFYVTDGVPPCETKHYEAQNCPASILAGQTCVQDPAALGCYTDKMKALSATLPSEYPRYAIAVGRDLGGGTTFRRTQATLEALVGPNIFDAKSYDDLESQYASVVSDLITQQQYECTTTTTTMTSTTATSTTSTKTSTTSTETSTTETSTTSTLTSSTTTTTTLNISFIDIGKGSDDKSAASDLLYLLLLLLLIPCCIGYRLKRRAAGSEDFLASGASGKKRISNVISSMGPIAVEVGGVVSTNPRQNVMFVDASDLSSFPVQAGDQPMETPGDTLSANSADYLEPTNRSGSQHNMDECRPTEYETIAGEADADEDIITAGRALNGLVIVAESEPGASLATARRVVSGDGGGASEGTLGVVDGTQLHTAMRQDNDAVQEDYLGLEEIYASSETVRGGEVVDFVEGEGSASNANPLLFASVQQNEQQVEITEQIDAAALARRASASRILSVGGLRLEPGAEIFTTQQENNIEVPPSPHRLLEGSSAAVGSSESDNLPTETVPASAFEAAVETLFKANRETTDQALIVSPARRLQRPVSGADYVMEARRIKQMAAAAGSSGRPMSAVFESSERPLLRGLGTDRQRPVSLFAAPASDRSLAPPNTLYTSVEFATRGKESGAGSAARAAATRYASLDFADRAGNEGVAEYELVGGGEYPEAETDQAERAENIVVIDTVSKAGLLETSKEPSFFANRQQNSAHAKVQKSRRTGALKKKSAKGAPPPSVDADGVLPAGIEGQHAAGPGLLEKQKTQWIQPPGGPAAGNGSAVSEGDTALL